MATSKLNPQQQKILKTILQVAKQKKASPKEIKAAVETGIVESNLSNPTGGDADSAGWRQERASLYADPTNVADAASRFFDEARKANQIGQYGSAGSLAAAVQRPAAQYRGRYQTDSGQANSLLQTYGAGVASPATSPTAPQTTTTVTTPGVDNSALRRQIVGNFLGAGGVKNSNATLALVAGYQGAQDVPAATKTTVSKTAVQKVAKTAVDTTIDKLKQTAQTINSKSLPYKWGGGHQGKVTNPDTPVDCSGAVSEVLGINPLVAAQFASWGKAGGGKRVTIYAAKNGSHVIMNIDGHFFGTSSTNPGGGAGWIPQADVSPAYLKNFVARHPAGM